jgi:release factor glutamine methyltransferase
MILASSVQLKKPKRPCGVTYAALLKKTSAELGRLGVPNHEQEAWWILAFASGWKNEKLAADLSQPAPARVVQKAAEIVFERQSKRPLAYATGEAEFYGLKIKVGPQVLIPRPETEVLVARALELLTAEKGRDYPFFILEVGTGSGCVVLALLSQLPNATAIAADISKGALLTAAENARALRLAQRVDFMCGNVLEPVKRQEQFDLIISNPPYIDPAEMASLDASVLGFEPRVAIESPQGGTWFHRKIARSGGFLLRAGGILAFEVGNRQAGPVSRLIKKTGFYQKPQVFPDLFGFERVVVAVKT